MTLRPPILTLFALSTFGCVITPGLLEGGADEADSTDSGSTDSDSTDSSASNLEFEECQRGTNLAGGSDPGEFPISTCMVCDQGWGHDTPQLPIEWTIELAAFPREVAPRSDGDGVVVVSIHDGFEFLQVSATGETLGSSVFQTPFSYSELEAGKDTIFIGQSDGYGHAAWVLALTQDGELSWSTPMDTGILGLAATADGGVVVAQHEGPLVRLDSAGSVLWTNPAAMGWPIEIAISAQGTIALGGTATPNPWNASVEVYAGDGVALDQFDVPGHLGQLLGLRFIDERRIFASGDDNKYLTAQLFDLDQPELGWTHAYNRASSRCYFDGTPDGEPSHEYFQLVERLADGSVLIAAMELGPRHPDNAPGGQPRLLHVDAQGNVLAADRVLWYGRFHALTHDGNGAAYAAMSNEDHTVSYLRKYQP